jgi:hypothetical protein
MLAAPAQIEMSMTYYWAEVSEKGNKIIPRWRPNKKRKGHHHGLTTNIFHLPPSRAPLFLIGHYL